LHRAPAATGVAWPVAGTVVNAETVADGAVTMRHAYCRLPPCLRPPDA
jgi:hypothetical protein